MYILSPQHLSVIESLFSKEAFATTVFSGTFTLFSFVLLDEQMKMDKMWQGILSALSIQVLGFIYLLYFEIDRPPKQISDDNDK